MKTFTAAALAVLMAASVALPMASTEAEARRGRGVAIGAGVALGILGAAAIANSNRAYADDRVYVERRDEPDQCGRWNYRCNRGNDWACEKFDRHC